MCYFYVFSRLVLTPVSVSGYPLGDGTPSETSNEPTGEHWIGLGAVSPQPFLVPFTLSTERPKKIDQELGGLGSEESLLDSDLMIQLWMVQ